jgi:hypothetical protein
MVSTGRNTRASISVHIITQKHRQGALIPPKKKDPPLVEKHTKPAYNGSISLVDKRTGVAGHIVLQ